MARYDDDDQATGEDWRALDGERPKAYRSDEWQRMDTSLEEDDAKQPWSRRTKLVLVGLALAAVFATAVALIQWLRAPGPACIFLAGARYDANLLFPPNVLGWKGLETVETWANQHKKTRWFLWSEYKAMRPIGRLEEHELTDTNTWERLTAELNESKFGEKTLVVFLSMFGSTDAEGRPVLFADDAKGKSVLPVQVVLETLKKFQDPSREEGKRVDHIVLLLDAVPVENHWQLGVFGNSFVSALRKLSLPRDMYVICSCDEDQRSWASEEWRRTVFAHFVDKGLRGAARDSSPLKITLADLFKYVEKNVDSWAQGNRDMNQKPIFLGDDKAAGGIDLVRVERAGKEEEPKGVFKGLSQEPQGLIAAWDRWKKLKAASAWTHAPQLWRQYQDALLRWEYLERTDCKERLAQIRELVKNDADAIENAQALKFTDRILSNCIPMAAGMGRAANPAALAAARELWARWQDEPDAKARKNNKAYQQAKIVWKNTVDAERQSPEALHAILASVPVDALLADKNGPSRDRIRKAAEFVSDDLALKTSRPIEAHLLVMLNKCALEEAPAALLLKALSVRRSAEQAILGTDNPATSSYCEYVFPLIKASITKADKSRRLGEDRLLGAESDWKDATKQLDEAANQFKTIQETSQTLRVALAARDRGWAELPYLGQWLTRHPVSEDAKANVPVAKGDLDKKLKTLGDGIDSLIELTRLLDNLLEAPSVAAFQEVKEQKLKLKQLSDRAKIVTDSCEELIDAGMKMQEKVAKKVEEDQLIHHLIECMLSVPLLKGKERDERIRQSRTITANLNKVAVEHKPGANRRKIDFAESSKLEKLADQLYGKAIAAGKERLFDGLAGIPDKIKSGLDESLKLNDPVEAKNLLRIPADYCRMIPGGRVPDDENKTKPFTAPDGWRRLHAHDLLLFLAKRTFDDHWYQEEDKQKYYLGPAVAYAQAAEKLAKSKERGDKEQKINDDRQAQAREVLKEVSAPAALSVEALTREPLWTTGRSYRLQWKIGAGANLPPGIPMVEFKNDAAQRKALTDLWPDGKKWDENLGAQDKPPMKGAKSFPLSVLYRGQRASREVEVKAQAEHLIVQQFIPPSNSYMAVRLDQKLRYKAVSIVLDTSGSMNWIYPIEYEDAKKETPKDGDSALGNRRYDKAVKALEDVLISMKDIKHLSVVCFGTENKKTVPYFLKKVGRWEPANKDKRDELIKTLRKIGDTKAKLQNYSPIADAIEKSMAEGFPERETYDGPKLVVVLTDGADNHSEIGQRPGGANKFFYKDSVANPAFKDISVAVVCFVKKDDAEYELAKEQFGRPEQQSYDRIFEVVEDDTKLSKTINRLILPKLHVEAIGGRWQEDREVSLPERNLNWGKEPLAAHFYGASVHGRPIAGRKLQMHSGQNILLTLGHTKVGAKWFDLERAVIAEQRETKENLRGFDKDLILPIKRWYATLYQSERDRRDGRLDQLVFLEKASTADALLVQQRPDFVWLEVEPETAGQPTGLVRWHNDGDWPAPAYRLRADGWPVVRPKLNVWWNDSSPSDANDSPPSDAFAKDLGMEPNGKPLDFKLPSASGVIDSLELEEQDLEYAPGNVGKQKCLVFRVQHDAGKLVQIRLNRKGWSGGEEHRYYKGIDQGRDHYTAIFYPWTAGEANKVEFKLICVESFKPRAHAARFTPREDVINAGEGDLFFKRNPLFDGPAQ